MSNKRRRLGAEGKAHSQEAPHHPPTGRHQHHLQHRTRKIQISWQTPLEIGPRQDTKNPTTVSSAGSVLFPAKCLGRIFKVGSDPDPYCYVSCPCGIQASLPLPALPLCHHAPRILKPMRCRKRATSEFHPNRDDQFALAANGSCRIRPYTKAGECRRISRLIPRVSAIIAACVPETPTRERRPRDAGPPAAAVSDRPLRWKGYAHQSLHQYQAWHARVRQRQAYLVAGSRDRTGDIQIMRLAAYRLPFPLKRAPPGAS